MLRKRQEVLLVGSFILHMLCVVEEGLLWKDRDVRDVLCVNVCLVVLVLHSVGQVDTDRTEVDSGLSKFDTGRSKVPSPKTVMRVYSSGQ